MYGKTTKCWFLKACIGALNGGGGGVPNVACQFEEIALMSHVSVSYFPQSHMSNLRNDYVPCYNIVSLMPHVTTKSLCRVSNFKKNTYVALSILGVKGAVIGWWSIGNNNASMRLMHIDVCNLVG